MFWIFSTIFFSQIFLILSRNERDTIEKSIFVFMWSIRCVCQIEMTRIFSTDFRKILKYQISLKPVRWEPSCSVHTDRHDEAYSCFFASFWTRLKMYKILWTLIATLSLCVWVSMSNRFLLRALRTRKTQWLFWSNVHNLTVHRGKQLRSRYKFRQFFKQ